jgi:hypothetical protein
MAPELSPDSLAFLEAEETDEERVFPLLARRGRGGEK